MEQALAEFLRHLSLEKNASAHTVKSYREDLTQALEFFRGRNQGKALEPFHYIDKGSLATIGRAAAVADFGRIKLSGFFAWLAWLLVHIFFLIGFRNRFVVMIDWAWAYFSYHRAARLITGDIDKYDRPPEKRA